MKSAQAPTYSLCSAHRTYQANCLQCNSSIEDLIPNYQELLKQAKEAGEEKCGNCGFIYYKTVSTCPACNRTS